MDGTERIKNVGEAPETRGANKAGLGAVHGNHAIETDARRRGFEETRGLCQRWAAG